MFVMFIIRHIVTSTLIQHKHTHTGEQPYVCDVCNKAYSDRSTMRQHKRTTLVSALMFVMFVIRYKVRRII